MSEREDVPPYRYTAAMANEIEARWQDYWAENGTFHAPNPTGPLADPGHPRSGAPKLYVMDMFPYPSGAGLHVGHPLGYIGTDCYARYQRMVGRNVLHAMGFDAFGLPAEQYAVQTGQHPRVTTEANVERYRSQLRRLGLAHDDRRSVATNRLRGDLLVVRMVAGGAGRSASPAYHPHLSRLSGGRGSRRTTFSRPSGSGASRYGSSSSPPATATRLPPEGGARYTAGMTRACGLLLSLPC